MSAQTINLKGADEIALQYLGAAVVLQWSNLPETIQKSLLQQADSVGGLPVVSDLHRRIGTLIRRSRDK